MKQAFDFQMRKGFKKLENKVYLIIIFKNYKNPKTRNRKTSKKISEGEHAAW